MKKIFSLILLSASIIHTSHATTLVPNLQAQMQRQVVVDQKAARFDVIAANRLKLASIRAKNSVTQTAGVTVVQGKSATPVVTEKIAATSQVKSFLPQSESSPSGKYTPANIDMDRVRTAWLSWNNAVRSELGLSSYSIDTRLNTTATEWSDFAVDRGYIIHGRPGDGCVGAGNYSCYNFSAIDAWFRARGIDPVIINRAKHTENLGTREYRCSGSDCTEAAISAARKTFDFFMSEKRYGGVHYRSLTNPVFQKIGLGFSVDPSKGVYYLTVHYITH